MKKKRILLGIALASASIFALASCGGSSDNTTDDDNQSETGGNGQNPSGNEGQGGGQQGGGEGQGGGQQGGGEGQQTETKYSITYNVNGVGTAPANKADVTAITDADLAAISAPGYIFEGWFTDAALTTAAVAGNISANTTLYAKWYGASYEAVKAKGNVALDETFDDDSMNIHNYSYNRSIFQQNIYFISSVHTDKPNSPKTNYRYSLANGIFTLVDNDASSGGDTKGSAKGVVNFGDTTDSKILEGYVDVTIPVKNNNWTFFQLYGTDTAKTNNEIFGLRTVEEGSGSDKKTYIQYRVDGTVTSTGIINKLEVTDNTSFGIHVIIDQVAGTISVDFVKADGTVLPYIKDVAIPGYKISTRYLFTSTDASNKVLSFDNVLLRGEGTIDDVDTYKAKVMAYFIPYLNEVESFYVTNATQYAAAKEALIAAVEAATTKDAINALIDVSSPQTASPEMIALMSIEDEWSIVSNYLQTNYPSSNYTINSEAFQQAYEAYYAAETAEQLIAAKDAFASIVPDADAKAGYIAEKVAAFQTLYPASNYTYEDNDYNNKYDYDALVDLITGNDKYEIDGRYNSVIVQAPSIPTNAALLDSAKTNYKNSLSSYRTDLTGRDLSSSDETAVAAYYNGDNFTARVTAGQTAIENADSLTNVRAAYDTFKANVDTDINGIILSKEDLTTQYNATLAEMKTAAKEEIEYSAIDGDVDAVAALVASDYDDKVALTTAYNAKVALIEKCVAWGASVKTTEGTYRDYALTERNKALDQTNIGTLISSLSSYFNNTRLPELLAIEYGTDTYDETIVAFIEVTEAHIDELVAAYRASTEVTVTFKKFADDDTAYDTKTIVKNTTVTAPETDPTANGYVFTSWDFDFTTNVSTNTTIVAKWHDVYSTNQNATSEATFKGMSALPNDDTDNTITFGKKNVATTYTVGGITYSATNTSSSDFAREDDGLKMSKKNQSISFVAPANSTVTIYLRNGKSDGSRMFDITSTAGLSLTSIGKNYTKPSSGADNVTVSNGKSLNDVTDQNAIKLVIQITTEQTITIKYSDNSTTENTVHVQQIAVAYTASTSTEISDITATATGNNDGTISISSVKLIPVGVTDPTKYIAITEGYSVYLDDATEASVITNGKIIASAGDHTVTIKYGKYTVYTSETLTVTTE